MTKLNQKTRNSFKIDIKLLPLFDFPTNFINIFK